MFQLNLGFHFAVVKANPSAEIISKSSVMIRRLLTIATSLFLVTSGASAAEPIGSVQFTSALRAAIAEKDDPKLQALIYFKGESPEDRQRMISMLGRLFTAGKDVGEISLGPLPDDFESVFVVQGKKIEPTATPRGMVKVTYKGEGEGPVESSSAYTIVDGRYFLVGMKSTDLGWKGPADRNIGFSVAGQGSSELQILGVWNASGVQLKKTFKESSITFWGQHFEELSVTSDHDDCDVTVTITEDGKTIYSEPLKGRGVLQYKKKG